MATIKSVLAGITLIAQMFWFVGLGFMLFDLFSLPDALFPDRDFTAEEIAPYLVETLDSYRPVLGVGIVGAIVAWLLILKGRYWATWFLGASRVFGWLWMPFIPIGTVLGALLLSSRAHAIESQDAT